MWDSALEINWCRTILVQYTCTIWELWCQGSPLSTNSFSSAPTDFSSSSVTHPTWTVHHGSRGIGNGLCGRSDRGAFLLKRRRPLRLSFIRSMYSLRPIPSKHRPVGKIYGRKTKNYFLQKLTVSCCEVWQWVVAFFCFHDGLQHGQVILEGRDSEALDTTSLKWYG